MRQHAPAELDQGAAVRVDELGFMVVQDLGGQDELLALAATLPIARAAYDAAVRMYIQAKRSSYAKAHAS